METFFTPKKLPILTLGLPSGLTPEELWGQQRAVDRFLLAMTFLQTAQNLICNGNCRIVKVDVSKADAQSYGRRQIVVTVEEMVEEAAGQSTILRYYPYVLRLRARDYEQALRQFLVLRPRLWETSTASSSDGPVIRYHATVVDLRLPNLGYVSREMDTDTIRQFHKSNAVARSFFRIFHPPSLSSLAFYLGECSPVYWKK